MFGGVFLQDSEKDKDEDDDDNFMVTTLIIAGCVSGILLISVCIFVILKRYCNYFYTFMFMMDVRPYKLFIYMQYIKVSRCCLSPCIR